MSRQRTIAWFVALCLLIAQQAGFAHGYSHAVPGPAAAMTDVVADHHDGADGPVFCPECLAFAGCHSFVPAAPAIPGGAAVSCCVAGRTETVATPFWREDCRTRAPPACA